MIAVILAAGVGRRMEGAYRGLPKCLIKIGGKTLLSRHIRLLESLGAEKTVVVIGYEAERVRTEAAEAAASMPVEFIENTEFHRGSILSLYSARTELESGAVIMDADVLCHPDVLGRLWKQKETCFCLDSGSVFRGEEMMLCVRDGLVRSIQRGQDGDFEFCGEGVGFFMLSENDAGFLLEELEKWVRRGETQADYEQVINDFLSGHPAKYVSVDGLPWMEIDFPEDVKKAEKEILNRITES